MLQMFSPPHIKYRYQKKNKIPYINKISVSVIAQGSVSQKLGWARLIIENIGGNGPHDHNAFGRGSLRNDKPKKKCIEKQLKLKIIYQYIMQKHSLLIHTVSF